MSANFNFTSDAGVLNDFVEGGKPLPKGRVDEAPVEPVLKRLGALSYDFDIVVIPPDAAQQAHLDALAALGQDVDDLRVEARWRDPVTVDAMLKASLGVRDLFKGAGFGLVPSGVGMAPGTYPAEDADARHQVVMRLTNALADTQAEALGWGRVSIVEFFKANAEAKAVRTKPLAEPVNRQAAQKRKFALIGLAVGVTLLVVAALSAL